MKKNINQNMNIFQKMYKSVYDFKSYVKFSKLSIGKGMIYLLVLSIILEFRFDSRLKIAFRQETDFTVYYFTIF